jgi:hypothetical protein
MKKKLLLLVLISISIASVSWAQTENQPLPGLKGEWKLDSIIQKQGENKQIALSPKDIIPQEIYYSCPVKLIFKEQAGSCRLVYENGETKDLSCYVYEIYNNLWFHIALLNNTPVPEWIFDYFLTATQTRLILTLEHVEESSDVKVQYEYFYSLIK